jgi:TRAP transporter 4TM/12TM fusion protein
MIDVVQLGSRGVAIGLTLLQLYTVGLGTLPLLVHYMIFLVAVLLLVYSSGLETASTAQRAFDLVAIVTLIASGIYLVLNFDRYVMRIAFVDDVTLGDKIFGSLLIFYLLEATRRVAGWGLFIIALIFTVYAFFGYLLPSGFFHSGMSIEKFIDAQILSSNGIFGIPLGAVVSYIFYFILFATFLDISGGGKLFIDLAFALTGRSRGGPAKSAVVASGVMGTINGSAVANVMGTGLFTIPLMKRGGYPASFAAAVEAASSTGGQLMPPIMGAAAFVMVELTGFEYVTIILGAAIPAILYYLGIFIAVDLKAKKDGLRGLARDEMPDVRTGLLRRVHLLLPIVALVYFLVEGWSLMMSAVYSLIATVVVSFVRPETRLGVKDILGGIERGARATPIVAVPCATAGLIIAVIIQTGVGIRLTEFILSLAAGSLILCLIAVMFSCIVLGMGMPTVAAYIMVAILMAPAMTNLHVNLLSAHLFIFYFALLSFVTPPVALASYAAAGIAQANSTATGWQAFRLTLPGFVVPYAFVYNPALVMQGSGFEVVWVTLTSAIGVAALAAAVIGVHLRKSNWIERAVSATAALLLISPEKISDAVGLALIVAVLAYQWMQRSPGLASSRPRVTTSSES